MPRRYSHIAPGAGRLTRRDLSLTQSAREHGLLFVESADLRLKLTAMPKLPAQSELGEVCRSQASFAARSVCDRNAFAPAPRRNRTEFLVCREDASKVAPRCLKGRLLWSGFGPRLRNCGHFWRFAEQYCGFSLQSRLRGGEGGIRTLGTGVSPYNGLANRRIRPLCHLSGLCGATVYHAIREWGHPLAWAMLTLPSLFIGTIALRKSDSRPLTP